MPDSKVNGIFKFFIFLLKYLKNIMVLPQSNFLFILKSIKIILHGRQCLFHLRFL
ncbi:Uncharacterised protein [Escherichia coli]|nr:Uncharacterised protein [Escherichia coli]